MTRADTNCFFREWRQRVTWAWGGWGKELASEKALKFRSRLLSRKVFTFRDLPEQRCGGRKTLAGWWNSEHPSPARGEH